MSTIAESTKTATRTAPREPRPSFLGSVGSEVLELRRQATVWAMLGLAFFFFAVLTAAMLQAGLRQQLEKSPAAFLFTLYDVYRTVFDTGCGIFLVIISARLVGMEYSSGTIRVLLARGAGRLRLLLAKLTALALLGVLLLAGFLALVTTVVYGVVVAWTGSFERISSLPGVTWTDPGVNVLVALASVVLAS